jgi:hypothetical protein
MNIAAGRGAHPYSVSNIDMFAWPGWATIIGPEPPLEGLQIAWDDGHPEDAPDRPASSSGKTLRFRVLERDGFTCRYCGRGAPDVVLHVDHVYPRSRGGKNDMANLVTACRDCNLGKRDMVLSAEIRSPS